MMKKEYIKPEMEETLIEHQQIMTTSPYTQPGFGKGEATDNEVLSTGRRGTWGNLWDGE